LKKASEAVSCFNVDVFDQCLCEAKEDGLDCGENDKAEDCKKCLEAKISTKNFESFMHWTCDRIMCPPVPSFEKYIRDAQEGSKDRNPGDIDQTSRSNCENFKPPQSFEEYNNLLNNADEYCKNAPRGLVGKEGPIVADDTCCAEEYLREWNPGCVGMNELKESRNLQYPEKDSQFNQAWRAVSDFKLCKPGGVEERQFFVDNQWFIFERNDAFTNAEDDARRNDVFPYEVYLGQRVQSIDKDVNKKIISQEDKITRLDSEKLTGSAIRRDRCDEYGDEIRFGDRLKWPTYLRQKSIIEETTGTNIPKNVDFSDINEGLQKKDSDYSIGQKITITRDNQRYTYEKKATNSWELVEVNGKSLSESNIRDQGTYIDLITKRDGKEIREKRPVPETIVREACQGLGEDFVVNPTDSIFRSIQCACLSGLFSYLKMYKMILGLIRDCFETILITGDGSAGICQATLSVYVCDLLYYMFSCFKGYSGFGTENEERAGAFSFFRGIVGAGGDVQRSVSNRYGDTNFYQVMFVDKKVVQAMCLGFFGADVDIDLTAIAESAIVIPIKSTVAISPATRRFVGFNPIDGITDHVYHVGAFMLSGANDNRYTIELLCSADNSCDPRYFENGVCDCGHGQGEITRDISSFFDEDGQLDQGEVLNDDAFITISSTNVRDASIRYDKVRVTYTFRDNTGSFEDTVVIKEISQVGSDPLAACQFDIIGTAYRCSVFEEKTTACITESPTLVVDRAASGDNTFYDVEGKDLKFSFYAKKQGERIDDRRFFADAVFSDDTGRTLHTMSWTITDDKEIQYAKDVKITNVWLGNVGTSGAYILPSGQGISSITDSANSLKDLEIDVTSKDDSTAVIEIQRKGESVDKKQGCTIASHLKSVPCGSYTIGIGDFNSISEGVITASYSTPTGTTSAQSRAINWELTIFRPKSDNPSLRSTTTASCDGRRQVREGSFIISKEQTGLDGPLRDTSGDSLKPRIIDFVINQGKDLKSVGPIGYTDGNASITVSIKARDEYDAASGQAASLITSASLVFDGTALPLDIIEGATIDEIYTNFIIENIQSPKKYTFGLEIKDGVGHRADIPATGDGANIEVWMGPACGDNCVCAPQSICIDYTDYDYTECSACTTGGLGCCTKK